VPTIELNGRIYAVDEDGFLEDPTIWNEQVAADLATSEEIATLNEDQWKLVYYLRRYYLEFGIAPMVRKLCKDNGFTKAQVYEMFPSGPAKGACKVAGLPKPTGCV
jgi:TusE/DsrC/DsvC family sulfur relay protein